MKGIYRIIGAILAVVVITIGIILAKFLPSSVEIETIPGIQISFNAASLSSSGMSYIITNETDEVVLLGENYRIEKKGIMGWKKLHFDCAVWTGIVFVVTEYSQRTFAVNWSGIYGELSSGEYRLIKPISINDKDFNIALEFEIQ